MEIILFVAMMKMSDGVFQKVILIDSLYSYSCDADGYLYRDGEVVDGAYSCEELTIEPDIKKNANFGRIRKIEA